MKDPLADAETDGFGVREGNLAEFDEEAGDLSVDLERGRRGGISGSQDAAFDGGRCGGRRLGSGEVPGRTFPKKAISAENAAGLESG